MAANRFSAEPASWGESRREFAAWHSRDCLGRDQDADTVPSYQTRSVDDFVSAISREFRFAKLERENAALSSDAERYAVGLVGAIVGLTSDLFGEVGIVEDYDPEYSDERYIVFIVNSRESIDTLLIKEQDWVRKVQEIAPNWTSFRLSIRPTE